MSPHITAACRKGAHRLCMGEVSLWVWRSVQDLPNAFYRCPLMVPCECKCHREAVSP